MSILAAPGAFNWGAFAMAFGVSVYVMVAIGAFFWMMGASTHDSWLKRAVVLGIYIALGVSTLAAMPS